MLLVRAESNKIFYLNRRSPLDDKINSISERLTLQSRMPEENAYRFNLLREDRLSNVERECLDERTP